MTIAVMAAWGGALAALWLAALWRSTRLLADRPRTGRRIALGMCGRIVLVAAFLVLAVHSARGWPDLAALFAGFLAMRLLVLAAVRRRIAPRQVPPGDSA